MSDFDDFELDEATLKQIEEEARKEVEADFELDDDTLKLIEQAAMEEAGLEDLDLGDDFMADLQSEVMTDGADVDGLELDDLDLGDLDISESKPKVAKPEPEVKKSAEEVKVRVVDDGNLDDDAEGAVQRAKREAYERAKQEALDRKKKMAVAKARHAVRIKGRSGVVGHASEMRQMEKQMVKKQDTLAMVGIIGGIILLFVVMGVGAVIAINLKPKPQALPAKKVYKQGGQVVDGPNAGVVNRNAEAMREFNKIVRNESRMRRGKNLSKANIEKELNRITMLRTNYPEFAAGRAQKLGEMEAKFKQWLELYTDPGTGGGTGGTGGTGGGIELDDGGGIEID